MFVFFSPNRFICRGPGGVDRRAHELAPGMLVLPASNYPCNLQCLVTSTSKTPRKVDKLIELLHSVREWHQFMS